VIEASDTPEMAFDVLQYKAVQLGCYATGEKVYLGRDNYNLRWMATTPKRRLHESFDDEASALRAAIARHQLDERIAKLPDRQRVEETWKSETETYEWYHLTARGEQLQGPFASSTEAIEAAETRAADQRREHEETMKRYALHAKLERIKRVTIPDRHHGLDLETLNPKNAFQGEAARKLASIDKNFLLCGPAKTGKTAVAAAAAASFVTKQDTLPARFVTVGEIVQLSLAVDERPLHEMRGVALLVIDAVQPFPGGDLEMAVSAMVAKYVRDILLFRCQSEAWHTIVVSDGTLEDVKKYLGCDCFGMVFEKRTDSTRYYNRGDVIEFESKGKR
jgi:DNA replication protein DnaC